MEDNIELKGCYRGLLSGVAWQLDLTNGSVRRIVSSGGKAEREITPRITHLGSNL
jgi:hypothetical protein